MASFSKTFDFNFRSDHQKKISYERRDYESVDEKSIYLRLCPEKRRKKIIQELKG